MTDASDAKKIAFKTELLLKLGLAAGLAQDFGRRVHMIRPAAKPGGAHRVMCTDGGWIEIDPNGGTVRTWGGGRTNREIAHHYAADESNPWRVEHLEPTAIAAAPGAPRRATPVLSNDRLEQIADGWRERGYDVDGVVDDGVWIGLGDTRLFDVGERVTIHGPVSDEAIFALVGKSMDVWDGNLRLFGTWTDGDRERVWLCCQRHNVNLAEFQPSAALLARWEAERESTGSGAARALRPDDGMAPSSAGPVPPMAGGSSAEVEPKAPPAPQDGVDEALARNAARAQANLDVLLARWAKEARTEADRDRLRKEEEVLNAKLAIYARARTLAQAEGLSREDAIRAAYVEVQDRDHEPAARLRR
ncbi:MAG: hypothetical protein JWR51_3858 [Devosia sp.]|uniref:hypothetical protein n=1 Tax=Devosia sp. TaxID=1871048 RepID=UPI002610F855|nr:hypothetical protein [Devosia sp.]MDB5530755.1 hypothetical protein [Devosia sp.]